MIAALLFATFRVVATLASQRMLHRRLGQLASRDYEQEAAQLVPRLLARELDVQDPAVLQRGWTTPDPEYAPDLSNICRQALERGDINQERTTSCSEPTWYYRADAKASRSTP